MSISPGQTIGQYRILEQIGQGGMATVYKAYQPSLDRVVAIKVLPKTYAQDPEFLARFRREAKAVAQLEHPYILPVHDYGEEGDVTYFVMRYVEGGSLADHLRRGPVDMVTALRITAQVAEALDYAHQRGIVHRDVKPSNILLTADGRPQLMDFGIAYVVSGPRLTRTGVGIGTPEYMSPEQGQGRPVDARSDIYSLGVVLYEMLTGRVPYQAETPFAVIHGHIYEPLPPPRRINPRIPPEVEHIVLKALAKRPEDRFQTAGEMAAALHQALRHLQQPGAVSRPAAPPPRRPFPWLWVLGGGAIALVVIACLLGVALLLLGPAEEEKATPTPWLAGTQAALSRTATAAAQVSPITPPIYQSTTPTPSPTSTPVGPLVVVTDTPTPTATPASTYTPTPTATPTLTPTPSPLPACELGVREPFRTAWEDAEVQARMGCPTNETHVTWMAFEPFENGFMVWREDNRMIYVLYNDGTWQSFPDTWQEGEPEKAGYTPPPGLYEPIRGFGKVWREQLGGPNAAIGWATAPEQGDNRAVQDFRNGVMLDAADWRWVLFQDDHTWQRY